MAAGLAAQKCEDLIGIRAARADEFQDAFDGMEFRALAAGGGNAHEIIAAKCKYIRASGQEYWRAIVSTGGQRMSGIIGEAGNPDLAVRWVPGRPFQRARSIGNGKKVEHSVDEALGLLRGAVGGLGGIFRGLWIDRSSKQHHCQQKEKRAFHLVPSGGEWPSPCIFPQ